MRWVCVCGWGWDGMEGRVRMCTSVCDRVEKQRTYESVRVEVRGYGWRGVDGGV